MGRSRLLRPLVRRRASALFDRVAGFVYSQVLLAVVELDLLTPLSQHDSVEPAALADHAGLTPSAMDKLLEAALALELVERGSDGRYSLGPEGAVLKANPGVEAMILHHRDFYRDLSDPVGLLKGETQPSLAGYWHYETTATEAEAARYSDLMARSQAMVVQQVLAAYPIGQHPVILDVGGGTGAFLRAIAPQAQDSELHLADLKPVAALARHALADLKVQVHAVDFQSDPLPAAADLVTLIRITHDHDDPVVEALLAKIFAYLKPGGTLLIAEPMLATPGAEAMTGAYFSFYFAAMGRGRPRSRAELTAFLKAAGFRSVRAHATPLPLGASVLSAQK